MNRKRYLYQKDWEGFTVVELLIVIVVIAILAAITAVAFNGIAARAIESSMKSDLETAVKLIENDNTLTGTYPADAASANQGKGLIPSGGNQFSYEQKSYGYCIGITNPGTSRELRYRSSDRTVTDGTCALSVTTIAGTGTAGSANGMGTEAQFNGPTGIAVDTTGVIYVSDQSNNRIRKIVDSNVSTFAGSTWGYIDDIGTAARFQYPAGIAIDKTGNLYVADSNSHRIRKITPAGVVTTFAGSGYTGLVDGTGTAARFNFPSGIAVDSAGVVYVADTSNERIRKITSEKVVSTLSDFGIASFESVAVDAADNLYVAKNAQVLKMTPGGTITVLADNVGNHITGLAVDRTGNVYASDGGQPRIRKVTPTGVVSTIAGTGIAGYTDGIASASQFRYPRLTVDASGVIYVVDALDQRIRKIE